MPEDPNMGKADVKAVLKAEYKLLCTCNGIKEAFDQYMQAF
jgi:hypothetical protein